RAQAPGTANGTLTVDGAAVELTNAYALQSEDIPELRMGDAQGRLVLLLSDRALAPAATASATAFLFAAQGVASHGLVLNLTADGSSVQGGTIAGGQGQFFAQTPGADHYRLENLQRSGDVISARAVGSSGANI